MDSCDADLIVCIFDDNRYETTPFSNHLRHTLDCLHFIAAQRQGINTLVGQHDKLHQVNRICTFTQDAALRSALTTTFEETFHILKIAHFCIGCEGLSRVKQFAVTCKDVSYLALGNGHERRHPHHILNGHQIVQTTAQHPRFKTCFTVQSDKSALD